METLNQYMDRRVRADSPLAELLRLPQQEQQRLGAVHTAREILQQPWVWRETARVVFEHAGALARFLERDGGITDVVFTGAGSSASAGLSLVPLFRQRCGLAALEVPTTDLLVGGRGVFLGGARRYLLVSLARSDESPESIGTVDRVLREFPEVRHLILCCNRDGQLARKYLGLPNVFTLVLPEATNDESLVVTTSFTSIVVAGQCIAELDRRQQYLETLEALAAAAERVLDASGLAQQVAESGPERLCLLGPRPQFGAILEGAMKVVETTSGRVVSLAETFLGLRHGWMVFLNPATAVLYFFSSDPHSRRYELDLAREVRAKGLCSISVALGPDSGGADAHLSLTEAYGPPIPDVYRAPLDVLFPQLVALFLALRLGLRPDAPSETGVIHRVVQGVTLYEFP